MRITAILIYIYKKRSPKHDKYLRLRVLETREPYLRLLKGHSELKGKRKVCHKKRDITARKELCVKEHICEKQ